ncbi:hypothetical protein SIPHO054v2_p0049 [Vibrio phage 103E44.1]|nr:hypothetical protein SIPHO054v2_p0049 [Vibrio phage 103E44.1]QZI87903.1 hypothetical protein SIPHO055v2_p0048 [Vibrio phage 104E43.1]
MKVNHETALLIIKLVREVQGVTHIYDCYLDAAFDTVSEGMDLTNVNPETVKTKACEILGLTDHRGV